MSYHATANACPYCPADISTQESLAEHIDKECPEVDA